MKYIYQPERYLLARQIERMSRYITGRVLDVGGGEFKRYAGLFEASEYISLDLLPGADVVGSAEALPFPDASFDSVVCTQVLEHVEHPRVVAREIERVLKPGGFALITVPQANELHSEPHDYWRYTCYGIGELMTEAGLRGEAVDQRGGFFTTGAQMITRYCIDRFSLYQHPIAGRVGSLAFRILGSVAMGLDRMDTSVANRKNTLGWCAVFRKE